MNIQDPHPLQIGIALMIWLVLLWWLGYWLWGKVRYWRGVPDEINACFGLNHHFEPQSYISVQLPPHSEMRFNQLVLQDHHGNKTTESIAAQIHRAGYQRIPLSLTGSPVDIKQAWLVTNNGKHFVVNWPDAAALADMLDYEFLKESELPRASRTVKLKTLRHQKQFIALTQFIDEPHEFKATHIFREDSKDTIQAKINGLLAADIQQFLSGDMGIIPAIDTKMPLQLLL